MEATIQDWNNFALLAGGASGALTGLLFVAVSLNRDRIVQQPSLRSSAVQTLVLFLLPLLVSIVLLTPGQSLTSLGGELVAVGLLTGVVLLIYGRRKGAPGGKESFRPAWLLDHGSPNFLTTLLIVVSGASLLAQHASGLYWLVPSVTFSLVGGVLNAWVFLVLDLA